MNSPLRLRLMTEADLAFADSLRAIVGWNQTIRDWQRLLSYEPRGCFIAEWNGSPIGTATTTRYGAELAWIGMLLVHPDFRARGIGKALLEHCLNHLRGTRCIKLDATPLGKKLYDKLGFQTEWPLTRWECKCLDASSLSPATDASRFTLHASLAIMPLEASSVTKIDRLDSRVFGVSRATMLEHLAAHSFAALVVKSEAENLRGYGLLREGAKAVYLGPVAATTPTSGIKLLRALLDQATGKSVYWDVPDMNSTAVSLVRELRFVPQRHLLRMYLGKNEHPGEPSNYYAIADPATG